MAALLALVIGMSGKTSRFQRLRRNAQAIWEERGFDAGGEVSKLQKFAHFWVLVWQSFTRNRCPVRASALAYASLLALIPMLAVVGSVTSSILKSEGEERIDNFVVKLVSDLVPPGTLADDESETNRAAADSSQGTNIAATVGAFTNRVGANLNGVATNKDVATTNAEASNVAA